MRGMCYDIPYFRNMEVSHEPDLRPEIDAIREQLQALTARIDALTAAAAPAPPKKGGDGTGRAADTAPASFPGREALWRATEHLAQRAVERGVRGIVAFSGSYVEIGEREYRWNAKRAPRTCSRRTMRRSRACWRRWGHRQRLALLKAILEQPATAAD